LRTTRALSKASREHVKSQMLGHPVMPEAGLLDEGRDLGKRWSSVKKLHVPEKARLVGCHSRVANRSHEDEELVFLRGREDLDRSVDILPEAVEDEMRVGKWDRERADG
jgi:hypothetical protein